MKRIISMVMIIITMLMAFPLTAIGQNEPGVSQYLGKILSGMVDEKQVKGAIVSVVSNGTNELSKGYGFADEEKDIAANGDNTAFRIGSISKTFVAIAALQLAEDGRLNMKAPVSTYLEGDFPKFKYNITMHDLLTHTAGFEDMFSGIAVYDINKAEPLELSIRKYMPAQVFIPGEVVSYSNYGIALAAYTIQCITGQDFSSYAEDNIFNPLSMMNTSFKLDFKGVMISKGYAIDGKENVEPLVNIYPEGSVVSTATDMSKYIQWLMDDSDKILSIIGKHQLFEQHYTMSDEFEGMGYAWSRWERNGSVYCGKKGETPNFHSRIVIYPKQKTGVFISFNTYVKEEKIDAIMDGITNLLLGHEKPSRSYSGEQTADISGYYIITRSNFQSLEKAINFLTPNNVFHIIGSMTDGFSMDGKKLLPIGENYYSTPIGNLKYVEKNGNVYLANKTAISYVRTNWYEINWIQILIVVSFFVLSLTVTVIEIISLIRKKADKINCFLAGLSIINITSFIGMWILIYRGLVSHDMLNMALLIAICAIHIMAISVSGALYIIYLHIKKIVISRNLLLIAWNISSILFCLWMLQVNIL